jgi:LPS-assembly lipoprotein
MDVGSAAVGVERFKDVPAAYTATMNATFVLSDIATDETLMTGRAFKSASYDFSNQRFANTRAYRDAQERVAKSVADDIAARVAGYFSSQS